MEIPEKIQEVLRCVECNELLSCGPVFLVHETSAAICGRCSPQSEEETSSRNIEYETIAKLLSFPCAFASNGCLEKMKFSEQQLNAHEYECDFRPCPVVEKGSCEWVGGRRSLLAHCRDAHPTHLFENTAVLTRPVLTRSHLVNYIITAFNLMFLLHLKICVSTGKLYHSVRLFNPSKFLKNFSYSFKIEGNDLTFNKKGSILPCGVLALQEHSSNSIKIESLLDFLGGNYNDSKFTLTIQGLLSNCLNCLNVFQNVTDSNICPKCQGNLVKCKFRTNGCLFVDVNYEKCWKHEKYFCKYQTKCSMYCFVNFVSGSFIEHLFSSTSCIPNSIKSNINSVVRLTKTNTNYKHNYIIFSSNNIGTIICWYYLTTYRLKLYLSSSLPFYELKNLKCSIELTDPLTKYSKLLTLQIENDVEMDWFFWTEMDNFPSVENVGIDMKINI